MRRSKENSQLPVTWRHIGESIQFDQWYGQEEIDEQESAGGRLFYRGGGTLPY